MKFSKILDILNEEPMMDVTHKEQKEILARREYAKKREAEENSLRIKNESDVSKAISSISKKISKAKSEGKAQLEIRYNYDADMDDVMKKIFHELGYSCRAKRYVRGMGDYYYGLIIDID